MPIPAGLTYVPGSVALIGGDAQSPRRRAPRPPSTARPTPDAPAATSPRQMTRRNVHLPDHLPLPRRATRHRDGEPGQGRDAAPLPAITAQFVASGPPGSVQNQLDTEYLVQTNVTESSTSTSPSTATRPQGQLGSRSLPPVAAPTPVASLTILPSVTATSTTNGNDNGSDAGGQTVQITGSGFTNAGGEQVNFGANPATSFTVNSQHQHHRRRPGLDHRRRSGRRHRDQRRCRPPRSRNRPTSSPTSPRAPPDFPVNVVPTSDNGQAEVSWTPAFNEGSPTQSYTVTATDVSSPSNDPNNGGPGPRDLHLHRDRHRRSDRLVHRPRPDQR